MNRSPSSKYTRSLMESQVYPAIQSILTEGVELDIRMEQARLNENNAQWLSRQAKGLRRKFKQLSD